MKTLLMMACTVALMITCGCGGKSSTEVSFEKLATKYGVSFNETRAKLNIPLVPMDERGFPIDPSYGTEADGSRTLSWRSKILTISPDGVVSEKDTLTDGKQWLTLTTTYNNNSGIEKQTATLTVTGKDKEIPVAEALTLIQKWNSK